MEHTPIPVSQEWRDSMRARHTGPYERVWAPGDTYSMCGCGQQVFEGKLDDCRDLQLLNSYEHILNNYQKLLDALTGLMDGLKGNVMLSGRLSGKRDAAERIECARKAIEEAS